MAVSNLTLPLFAQPYADVLLPRVWIRSGGGQIWCKKVNVFCVCDEF